MNWFGVWTVLDTALLPLGHAVGQKRPASDYFKLIPAGVWCFGAVFHEDELYYS